MLGPVQSRRDRGDAMPGGVSASPDRSAHGRASAWTLSWLALLASACLAGSASAETLDEALALAYGNNPRLEARRAELRATDELVPQALSGWRPNFEASGSVGGGYQRDVQRLPSRGGNQDFSQESFVTPNSVTGQISQPVFRGGQTIAQTREAENRVRAGRERLTATEQEVLLDAATAYMDVFSNGNEVALTIQNEQRLVRQLEATRDRFQVGEVTRTDVFQAEARLAEATADRIQAEGRLEASRAAYRRAVGQSPGSLVRPAIPEGLPRNLDEAVEWAIDGNPNVLAGAFEERSALDAVDRARGQLLPTVRLIGRVSRQYEANGEEREFTNYEALVQMDVPIYAAGTAYSQVRQRKQQVVQSRRDLDSVQRDTVRTTTDAWTRLETARAAIVFRKKQVETNQVALEGVQREAEVGARTVLDVLNAEQELLQAEVNLVRAQRDEVVAAYQLKSAVGELTARRLRLDVPLYDPTIHYREVRGAWFGTSSPGDNSGDFDRSSATR